MNQSRIIESNALCPHCGWDETQLVEEFDIHPDTGEETWMEEHRECPKCHEVWDVSQPLSIEEMM